MCGIMCSIQSDISDFCLGPFIDAEWNVIIVSISLCDIVEVTMVTPLYYCDMDSVRCNNVKTLYTHVYAVMKVNHTLLLCPGIILLWMARRVCLKKRMTQQFYGMLLLYCSHITRLHLLYSITHIVWITHNYCLHSVPPHRASCCSTW